MRNTIFLSLFFVVLFLFSCETKSRKDSTVKKEKKITIKGKILNYEQDTLYLEKYGENLMSLTDGKYAIPLSQNKDFEYSFEASDAGYYRTGRTFLYLSPGDDLEMTIDTYSRAEGLFKGKGSQANTYLTMLPYPKAGSFWSTDEVEGKIKTYEEAPNIFNKIKKERLSELEKIKDSIPSDFFELEKERLNFDYINSLLNVAYLYYPDFMNKKITQDEMMSKIQTARTHYIPYIKETLSDLKFKNEYLQLGVFQSLLYYAQDTTFSTSHGMPKLSSNMKQYMLAKDLKQYFSINGYTDQFEEKYDSNISKITNTTYLEALQKIRKSYSMITKGALASDVTFSNFSDENIKLSNYKGKVIVVDLWATWCQPCMLEKPHFEALEKKYKKRDDIVFLSVSIDTKDVWKEYFAGKKVKDSELQIYRDKLSAYKIAGIPRFFVIDKDFKIVSVFAPMPSSGKLEKMINTVL